jgi:hypothetical protein
VRRTPEDGARRRRKKGFFLPHPPGRVAAPVVARPD